MDIRKNPRDYQLSHKQRVFASFLKEKATSYICDEKITNAAFLRKYFAPENDFTIYSLGADPAFMQNRRTG
ncbi:hypothetical protein KBA27_04400 [bacterium]|nr:hypothetical protein [bacterium]